MVPKGVYQWGERMESRSNYWVFSANHIDVIILENDEMPAWRLIGFYGAPEENNRHKSWDLLRRLNTSSHMPWMVVGNFNEIMFSFEKKGGRIHNEWNIVRFREVLSKCNLSDVSFTGKWFTWERGRLLSNNVRERLDKGVANQAWWSFFSKHSLKHLTHAMSDHCPIQVELGIREEGHKQKKHFNFNASWAFEEEYEHQIW